MRCESGQIVWPKPECFERGLSTLRRGGFVVLVGKRGTGKTQMAACFARELAGMDGVEPWYTTLADFYGAIRRSFDAGNGDPRPRARAVGALFLDECHERFETVMEDLELTRLVDARYGEMRATMLIANLRVDELPKALGASATSRIQECGVVIECDWPSFREGGNAQ